MRLLTSLAKATANLAILPVAGVYTVLSGEFAEPRTAVGTVAKRAANHLSDVGEEVKDWLR